MKLLNVLISIIFAIESCSQKPKIKITTQYIASEYWKKPISNFFIIERMKVKQDSLLYIFQPGFNADANSLNIVQKLEEDSLFAYQYLSKDKHSVIGDTIYFNKSNKGDWYTTDIRLNSLGKRVENIGNLENNTWYKFSKLRDRSFYIYAYVDSVGKVYCFNHDSSNY